MIHLHDRTVIKITGSDARKFLQGLITNDIDKLTLQTAVYAALQTAQGKYLFDFVIYQIDDEILIDVEKSRAPELLKKLGMYKLRSDIKLENTNYKIYSDQTQGITDPRNNDLGKRLFTFENQIEDGLWQSYETLRLQLGIPETKDLIPEKSFITQNNFEQLNAIDYNKGCYIGQEIVARVKYKSAATRQIFKVTGEGELPEFGTPIMHGQKLIGEMRSHLGNIGLVQCVVDAATDVEHQAGEQMIKLEKPNYII